MTQSCKEALQSRVFINMIQDQLFFYVSSPLKRPIIGELCQHTESTLCSPCLEGICKRPPSLSLPQVRVKLESFWPHTPADQEGICQNWEAMGLQISTVYKIPPDRVVSLPVSASAYSACPAPLMRISLPSSWWSKNDPVFLPPNGNIRHSVNIPQRKS